MSREIAVGDESVVGWLLMNRELKDSPQHRMWGPSVIASLSDAQPNAIIVMTPNPTRRFQLFSRIEIPVEQVNILFQRPSK